MTDAELYTALRTKRTVLFKQAEIAGQVVAVRMRHENEADILSAEVKPYSTANSLIICRPQDIDYWDAVIKGKDNV